MHKLGEAYAYLAVSIVYVLGFSAGTLLTWTSPILPKLKDPLRLDENPLGKVITDHEEALIGSLNSIGGIGGPLLFSFIFQCLGRKIGTVLVNVPFLVATICGAFGNNIWYYYVSRIFAGVGIGASFTIMPIYSAEVTKPHNRGILSTLHGAFIMAGLLFSYVVGPYTSIMVFNIILSAISIFGIIATILLVPESPYYLYQDNKLEKALQNLQMLRGSTEIHVKMEFENEIKNSNSKLEGNSILEVLRTKAAWKGFLISLTLLNLQQFCGITCLLAYTENIFKATGSSISSDLSAIIVGIVQFITNFLTPLGVEKFGRRILLMISSAGMVLSLATLGIYFYYSDRRNVDALYWLPVTAMVIYFTFYNSGIGGIPWTIMSELLPVSVTSVGSSIITSMYYVAGFLINYYFNSIVNAIGMGETFWMFAGITCGTFLFVFFIVPETKGKSLNEIQEMLDQ